MRVLVISDTHKKHENLKVVLERVSPVDLVIHLGDAAVSYTHLRAHET